ncbi:hypothetical protein C7B77_12460 [Chamaesiphon polymorphus CCALA 037]|uniref:Uncharacterized protein n=1 Tax=Chamaesiphon polymorphus CCALA 037 TaxID=2107692 RepID=A0A2T1GF78_9CYAN|nr:hypothetical protein C7B77_12460 [Chamaesiphon polymorphus CCALA 037]
MSFIDALIDRNLAFWRSNWSDRYKCQCAIIEPQTRSIRCKKLKSLPDADPIDRRSKTNSRFDRFVRSTHILHQYLLTIILW